ncbi:MAG: alkaline phosphatase family protein [Actinomycetota bacterium]
MNSEKTRPDHAGACITNVVRALQGGADWIPDVVRGARATVLFVCDGLGWNDFVRRRDDLPNLRGFTGGPITSVVPSTTPTALCSISTGLPPAEHGVMGYRVFVGGGVLNVIRWAMQGKQTPDPDDFQPRVAFDGQALPVVTRATFKDTNFSRILYRGATFEGYMTTSGIAAKTAALIAGGERFVYAYYDGLDLVAHVCGLRDDFYPREVAYCDRIVGDLLDSLPDDVAVVVMADHGHVHFDDRVELGPLNELCIAQAGESRFRYLHAKPGATGDLLAGARELVGGRAWVFTRDEMIDDG